MLFQPLVSTLIAGTANRIGNAVPSRRFARNGAVACLAFAMLGAFSAAAVAQESVSDQLNRLRRDLEDLQAYVYRSANAPRGTGTSNAAAAPESDALALLQRQVLELQSQMRDLTGKLEEVRHDVRQANERMDKLVSDVDLRLQALEHGPQSQTQSNPQSGMAQPPATVQTRQEGETTIISSGDSAGSTTAVNKLAPGSKLLGTVSPQSVDSIHEGRVPAQQPAAPTPSATARNAAQAPPPSAAPGPGDVVTGSTQVGTANPGHVLPDAPVQEQYNYAFKLLQQRDYTGAEAALREFVNLHPKEPLAGNAMYWMGETFYVRKNYPEAARIFLDAYQRFPKGNKAPDNLFKLGRSLAEIGENSSACTTYSELLKSFPHANERILSNARGDMARLKCS